MNSTNSCPECGALLPLDSPRGLCPKCLMGAVYPSTQGLGSAPKRPDGEPKGAKEVDLSEFLRTLREMNLVADEAIDRLLGGAAGDPSRLARILVQAGLLTGHQAGAVLQGKAHGLAIGEYLVLDKLGVGGMGIVFRARHRPSGRVVALKMLPPSFGREREAVGRFRREFQVASRLSHPNVVAAIEASEDRGVHFLTMEYIEGYDLERLVAEGGPMAVKLALHCAIQAARGLEAAHAQGVIHRDIKPGNVMIDASGSVRILDLGLARVIEATSHFGKADGGTLTQTGTYMGTVDFLAPEQADDAKRADHRADIYSLGCTLHFLLTGRPPFEGETVLKRLMAHQSRPAPSLRAARPEVSEAIEEIFQKMMAKRPSDRPQTISEVVIELEACRSSPREAGDASGDLKTFARTAMKRASPRGRRGPDASVFARTPRKTVLEFDPDLRLEDLVADYRDEIHHDPLSEEKLPPKPFRPPAPARRRRKGGPPAFFIGAFAALALVVAGVFLFPRREAEPAPESERAPGAIVVDSPSIPAKAPVSSSGSGFRPLFNGRDLSGWAGDLAGFEVRDGAIRSRNSKQSVIYSKDAFGDFAARVEFRLAPGGNGGLAIRYPGTGDAAYAGMCEVQILDENAFPSLDPRQRTGSAYALAASSQGHMRAVGIWNEMEVTARGSSIKVVLNGSVVLDRDLAKVWDFLGSKPHPGTSRSSGFFGLLHQDGPIEYRNVEIRVLEPSEFAGASEGFVPLFNGKDLAGWVTDPRQPGDWRVERGVLIGSGRVPSYLYSGREHRGDLVLRVEARINDGGNSGVVVRSSDGPTYPAEAPRFPDGYEAQINSTHADPNRTGSLYRPGRPTIGVPRTLVPPGEWFEMEIKLVGTHVIIKVNGDITVDYDDVGPRPSGGRIALQQHDPETVVEFRRIAIKEGGVDLAASPRRYPAESRLFGGKHYQVFKDELTWHAARIRCEAMGGHLAIVTSDAEQRFVTSLASAAGLNSVWLGATDEVAEGWWVWVDGSPMKFSAWDTVGKQPNNKNSGEHYLLAVLTRDGKWSDQPTRAEKQWHPGFVCQWD